MKFLVAMVLLLAAPAWASPLENSLCQRAALPVDRMTSGEKFCRSLSRAVVQLPQSVELEAQALLTPENLSLMAATTATWAGTQGIPIVGQAVDAALMSVGVVLLTAQSAALSDALWRYANRTRDARSHAELDEAATYLSRALSTAGVNVVAYLLTRKALSPGHSGSMGPPQGMAAVLDGGARLRVRTSHATSQAPALAMVGAGRPPSTVGDPQRPSAKTLSPQALAKWLQNARKRPTRSTPAAYGYQQRHAGLEEVLVEGGGEQIWADGVKVETGRLIEAKFVDAPERSPFVEGSKCNENVRRWIQQEVGDEFRRYAAAIASPETPVVALEVVTNEARAVPFFEALLRSFNIPGEVVVRP